MKFYHLPNSNLFTHRLLFFSREATSETYAPPVSFSYYLPLRCILFSFYFHIYYTKNTKIPCCNLFVPRSIYHIYKFTSRPLPIVRRRTPKGIDNPFNTSGCKVLLFVCWGCLSCVAWFSYWFDNLSFIYEGNTYHRCAASSLPLWRNTDVASSDIKRNFRRRCRGGSSTYTRFLITNLISSQFTLFSICLSFSSPPLHKNLPFYSPLFFVRRFLAGSVLECNLVVWSSCLKRTLSYVISQIPTTMILSAL